MNNNKVDHPRKKSKDLADAVCGAIFGAISHTYKSNNEEVEIHTFRDRPRSTQDYEKNNVITYNKIPDKELEDYFSQFKTI